jgi:hypothetical protein
MGANLARNIARRETPTAVHNDEFRVALHDHRRRDDLHELRCDQPQVRLGAVVAGDDRDRAEAGVDERPELEQQLPHERLPAGGRPSSG